MLRARGGGLVGPRAGQRCGSGRRWPPAQQAEQHVPKLVCAARGLRVRGTRLPARVPCSPLQREPGGAWAAAGLVTGAAAGAACAPSGEGTPAWGQVSRAGGRQPVAWLAQARGPLSCCKKPKTSQPCSWFEKRHTAQKRIA